MFKFITAKQISVGFKKGNDYGDNHILVGISMLIWDVLYGVCAAIVVFLKGARIVVLLKNTKVVLMAAYVAMTIVNIVVHYGLALITYVVEGKHPTKLKEVAHGTGS